MKFDMDLETGKVKGEFTIDEAHEILAALKAVRDGKVTVESTPATPLTERMWKLPVCSFTDSSKTYQTRIWFDVLGEKHGACQCGDSVFRKKWCKHLGYSDAVRMTQLAAALSMTDFR
jgi:hypothetical protein